LAVLRSFLGFMICPFLYRIFRNNSYASLIKTAG